MALQKTAPASPSAKDARLPLASLRLLVPPLQLLSASMWRIVKKKEVKSFWKVSDFVLFVMEIVPELLLVKHWTQLTLGLRAQFILELCKNGEGQEFIQSHLEKIKTQLQKSPQLPEISEQEKAGDDFEALIHVFLTDSQERQTFFQEVWSAESGALFDSDLQMLLWEFLCRLNQLLPAPELDQIVSWLGESCVFEDFLPEPTNVKNLLQHHKQLGHLEPHVSPSALGELVMPRLSTVSLKKSQNHEEKCSAEAESHQFHVSNEDLHPVLFVEDVAMEIVTVTEYAEVELTTNAEVELTTNAEVELTTNTEGELTTNAEVELTTNAEVELTTNTEGELTTNTEGELTTNAEVELTTNTEGELTTNAEVELTTNAEVELTTNAEVELTTNTEGELTTNAEVELTTNAEVELTTNAEGELTTNTEEREPIEEKSKILEEEPSVLPLRPVSGPHACPDCDKKFKFASFLVAHRVIHTGERPHKCSECGRCFSFRQSLERHRHTHKKGRSLERATAYEECPSLAARNAPRQIHTEAFDPQPCDKTFNREHASERHVEARKDRNANRETVESVGEEVSKEVCKESVEEQTSGKAVMDAQFMNQVISLVKVRTSARKRKPTMKVQMSNLQKMNKRRKQGEECSGTKPSQLSKSSEHSYGAPTAKGEEGAVTEGAVYSCSRCAFSHSEEDQVHQHINASHFTLPDSERTPEEAPAEQTEGRYSCPHCPKTFKFHSILTGHLRTHTGEQPYACAQCDRRFTFKQSLERHKLTHKTGCSFKCTICGELFLSSVDYKEHTSAHKQNGEYFCSKCGKNFAWKSAFVRHSRMFCSKEGKNRFKCPHCEFDFDAASSLNAHIQSQHEAQLHVCVCGKGFAYKAALTSHQRVHQKDKPHVCNQCGKGFLYRGGLLTHSKTHSQEMPFACSFCGKGFKRERNMKKHERCHTREGVFKCPLCDKSFVYKATLTRHELTHSGERPFLCAECGKGFFSHAELLKHERFHTGLKPFECPHCGKRFTQSCYLTIHLRYHTGAKPYTCGDCGKSFLSANRLKRHQRTHTGERPYLCVECGKGFRQSYHLKMHQRTHAISLG